MARTDVGTSPRPEMKMMGRDLRLTPMRFCSSSPSKSGRHTSSTMQVGADGTGLDDRKSCADANVCGRHPAESISNASDSRTEGSSSTTNTTDVACDMSDDLNPSSNGPAAVGYWYTSDRTTGIVVRRESRAPSHVPVRDECAPIGHTTDVFSGPERPAVCVGK